MQALSFYKSAPAHLTKNQDVDMVPKADVPEIPKANPLYPVMSDAVTFKYEDNRGRYAVANKVTKAYILTFKPINLTLQIASLKKNWHLFVIQLMKKIDFSQLSI